MDKEGNGDMRVEILALIGRILLRMLSPLRFLVLAVLIAIDMMFWPTPGIHTTILLASSGIVGVLLAGAFVDEWYSESEEE